MPIDDNFTFNGQNSADFGLLMASDPEAIHPERRGKSSQIVGRNGVFVREDGSYDTYTQTYDVLLDSRSEGVYARSRKVANWLLGSRGFCRLEDTFEPDVFKLARYAKQLSVENRLTRFGRAKIAFEVQPQRYLKIGETEISIEGGEDGDIYYGTIRTHGIPYGAVSAFMENNEGVIAAVGEFRDANGAELGQHFYATPVTIPSGTATIGCAYHVQDSSASVVLGVVDADGNRIILGGIGGVRPTVYNPTQFEARPLLKFVDTSEEKPIVQQNVTKVAGTHIYDKSGVVYGGAFAKARRHYTTEPISVSGNAYAYITGVGYSFYDSGGIPVAWRSLPYNEQGAVFAESKISIPANAETIVVEGRGNDQPHADDVEAKLSLQMPRETPSSLAVTVNGTSINVDFSSRHDTVFLDCDLHDAYYLDGSSANGAVSFTSTADQYPTFPGLSPGENVVEVHENNNLQFSIIPRWWEL